MPLDHIAKPSTGIQGLDELTGGGRRISPQWPTDAPSA